MRGSEVNSLSCEGLGGSNPLCGPLETLLRASYREPQPPAIQNIHHHHHHNRLLEGGRRVGSWGGGGLEEVNKGQPHQGGGEAEGQAG